MKPQKYILKRVHRSRNSMEFRTHCKKCHFRKNPGCEEHPCEMGQYYIRNPEFKTTSQQIRDLDVLMTTITVDGREYVPISVEEIKELVEKLEKEENGHS